MNFESFGLHPKVLEGVKSAGYKTPTPIQAQSIPPMLEGRDMLGLAQTGTGKTAAFVLPILHRLMSGTRKRVRALIVAPTRELAEQTNESILVLGKATRLKSVTVYGGVNIGPQMKDLKAGAEIVVACPGRLLDVVQRGGANLSQVEVLVLDEADRMLDMGFMPDIKQILRYVLMRRQTMLFSATMPSDVLTLANEILFKPVNVEIAPSTPAETVSHAIYPVAESQKAKLLMAILKDLDEGSVLVFTRTRVGARTLTRALTRGRYKVAELQGDLTQMQRDEAMEGFRDGTYRIMVATDIAARGLDISSISHVINYDIPDSADSYTHRIGRTGRAGESGDAFTFYTNSDANVLASIEKVMGTKIERRMLEGFRYEEDAPRRGRRKAPPSRPARHGKPGGGHSRAAPNESGPAGKAASSDKPHSGAERTSGAGDTAMAKKQSRRRRRRPPAKSPTTS